MKKSIPKGFKEIKGHEGRYAVSKNGEVFSLINNIVLKQAYSKSGYPICCLYKRNKGRVSKQIHRLVMETFEPRKDKDVLHVNHVDGNKTNNHINNLEWCTPSENAQHAYTNGLYDTQVNLFKKFVASQRKPVVKVNMEGEVVSTYPSITKAAEENEIAHTKISECCNGKKKTYYKHYWKFI